MKNANNSAVAATGTAMRRHGNSRPWNWCTAASTMANVPDSSVLARTMLAQSDTRPRRAYSTYVEVCIISPSAHRLMPSRRPGRTAPRDAAMVREAAAVISSMVGTSRNGMETARVGEPRARRAAREDNRPAPARPALR